MSIVQFSGHNGSPFDSIRHFDGDGNEYWAARELMPLLGYTRWQRFEGLIERAKAACLNSGASAEAHFTHLPGAVSGQGRFGDDYNLTRYACYLIAMNGDPRKPQIAAAQTYFAVQTYRAETELSQPTIASPDPVSNLKNAYDPERKLSTLPMVCAAMEAAGFGQSAIQLHVVARLKLEGLMEHPSLVPPVEAMAPIASPKAFLKPAEIATELGWLYKTGTPNSRSVNAALESLGYQRKVGRHWEATEKGASLCERRPVVVANKKADVDQLLWRSDIVAVLREQF